MKRIVFMAPGAVELNDDGNLLDINPFLSEKGNEEAREAGRVMKMESLQFDIAFTSHKKGAIKTLWLVLEEMDRMCIPVFKSEDLNELSSSKILKMKEEQIIRYWEEEIYPMLGLYDTILVVAHKSTLSILVGEITGLINSEIEFPNGVPYIIEFNTNFEREREYFIGNK